jgi:transglutaminase/protease-like cytokinesis protein 3
MTNGSVSGTSMTNGSVSGTSMTNGTVSGSSNNRMMTQSAMTNGTVSHASMNASTNQNAMTNGNVSSAGNNQRGGKQITVSYNGQKEQVWVPASAPIVKLNQASHSVLKKGAKVFVIAKQNNGQWVAKMVAVGKNGLKPPM